MQHLSTHTSTTTSGSPQTVATRRAARQGFTLIELLGVMLIIAILIGIAFPAYQSVIRKARATKVRAEMSALESSIATFKAEYGIDPPSSITFAPVASMPANTKAVLRQMFPQISYDINLQNSLFQAGLLGGTLASPTSITLNGSQALVFFLGGVRRDSDGVASTGLPATDLELTGFSKNPGNPFAQQQTGTDSRNGPYFEFNPAQLKVTGSSLSYTDAFPGQTAPYSYVDSSRYTSPPAGTVVYKNPSGSGFWNADSYQLVSPGQDATLGASGLSYDPAKNITDQSAADNMANFSTGTLGGK